MTQGEEGDTYVMVEPGGSLVAIDGAPHHEQGPGDGVGEIALLRSMPRTATVTALEPVEGCGRLPDVRRRGHRPRGQPAAARRGRRFAAGGRTDAGA